MERTETKRVILIRSNPVRPYPRLEKMANCLAKNGHQVTVLAWDRDENYPPREEVLSLKTANVKIMRIGIKGQFSGGVRKNLKGLLMFQHFIFTWLTKYKETYDVVHAYDFDTGFTALVCARHYKKKFIYDIPDYYVESHGLNNSWLGKLIKRLEDYVITNSDATIICTEERKKQIKDALPKELVVVHNTPDNSIEQTQLRCPGEKLKLVYVGIFGKARYIDRIVEVVSARDDCEFHIGGFGGDMEQFFEEAAQKFDNIFYYGRIPYEQTLQLEKECDVMCALYDPKVPNHYYAAPNKFYEGLILGKPLIMAKNTGMASVVEEFSLGEVIDYSKEALNAAITRLAAQKSTWPEIGQRAQQLYKQKYSWDEMESRIVKLYKNI